MTAALMRGLRALAIGSALAIWSSGFVVAGPFDDGWTARMRGDYPAALAIFRRLAEHGDARAQSQLGDMYQSGQGVSKDDHQAFHWYLEAATGGDQTAQLRLAVLNRSNRIDPRDAAQLNMWCKRAAAAGNPIAAGILSVVFARGDVEIADAAQAKPWFEKEAEQGSPYAMYDLGELALRERPPNYVSAYSWFDQAAARPPTDSNLRDKATQSRNAVAPHLNARQVDDAGRQSANFNLQHPSLPPPLLVVRASPPTVTIANPEWQREPTSNDLAKFYPDRARRMGIEGQATMTCLVQADGSLNSCALSSEEPADQLFGEAALRMVGLFKMKPATIGDRPIAGARVNIPISFRLPKPTAAKSTANPS